MRLSTFAAVPRLIRIGGVSYLAPRLRVGDLAEIEAWFESVVLDGHPDVDPDSIEGWPPTLGGEVGARLISTREGLAKIILLTIGRHDQSVTVEIARGLAESMEPREERDYIRSVFPEAPPGAKEAERPDRPMDWRAAILKAMESFRLPPREFFEMPLDTFFGLFEGPSRGRGARNWDIPIRGPEHLDQLWREHEAKLKAEGGKESNGAAP